LTKIKARPCIHIAPIAARLETFTRQSGLTLKRSHRSTRVISGRRSKMKIPFVVMLLEGAMLAGLSLVFLVL
jgi:hypothetical protein